VRNRTVLTMTEIQYSDFSSQMPGSVRGRRELVVSGAPVYLRSEQIFSVRGSHRRVRLRSVYEREHILLEHDAYINNNERETAIF
jgi:hypothetical protein